MDSRSSNRRLLLAILAGAGLVVVMCVALVAIVWVANGGSGRLSGQRAVQSLDRIAFVGPDDSLYVTDRNGQDVELLVAVEEGTSLGYPTWSPDGRRVAYLAWAVRCLNTRRCAYPALYQRKPSAFLSVLVARQSVYQLSYSGRRRPGAPPGFSGRQW
jgi:hypothetical protein